MIDLKKLTKPLIIFYLSLSILLGASYILQSSIRFDADISRDFLLLDELATKKYILIGPRASGIPGVFHGPLWIYLNFPAYYLGQTNPVVVGFGWIGIIIIFLFSSYLLIKNISSKKTAIIFTLLLAGMLIPWMHQLLNPFGALSLMPLLIFLIIKYQENKNMSYWIGIIFTLGAIIQFQMAVGVPISILVISWLSKWMYKNKKLKHLFLLPLFLIPLASFLIFDLRHDFGQTKAVINFITNNTDIRHTPFLLRLSQRIQLLTQQGLHLFTSNKLNILNLGIFVIISIQLANNKFKLNTKNKNSFNLLFYLYIGFYIISLLFNGTLLIYYWWPLVPISYLMFSIIISNTKNKYLQGVFVFILITNLIGGIQFLLESQTKVGQIEDDWLFQKNMVEKLFQGEESEFGYFIFTPDVYAYESKAAMTYAIKNHPEKNVTRYEKQEITYLILSPADKIRPEINYNIWKDQRLNLDPKATPSATINYLDGYKIEKFNFNQDEINEKPDSTINDWLHFR